jgi:glycerol-1-phosphate dehydrogenase [NAD(P)+]
VGDRVEDLAALLSDATVSQLTSRPVHDLEGERLLATALLLNGVSMEIAGSSRPASGSEHLISHALDALSARPRLHGLQVGVAAFLVSVLQGVSRPRVEELLVRAGFFEEVRQDTAPPIRAVRWHGWQGLRPRRGCNGPARLDPLSRAEWLEAVSRAPSMKPGVFTILDQRPDAVEHVARTIDADPVLAGCFI